MVYLMGVPQLCLLLVLVSLCSGIFSNVQTSDSSTPNIHGYPNLEDSDRDEARGFSGDLPNNHGLQLDDEDESAAIGDQESSATRSGDYDIMKRETYELKVLVESLQTEVKKMQKEQQELTSSAADSLSMDGTDPGSMPDESPSNFKNNEARSIYTRWGREDCPSTANTVYAGFAAGTHREDTGGGSNYLCLPREPIYNRPIAGSDFNRAQLFSVDYEDFETHLDEYDAPCVVCESIGRSTILMVPARIDCPEGWLREYYGYLMSQKYSHQKSEFVCVDYNAKGIPGTGQEAEGGDFFAVEGGCFEGSGSFLCDEPYVAGYELTCAVCSK